MNKVLVLMFIFFLLDFTVLTFVSALRINEIEINPPGSETGTEWIELYNEGDEINVSGWKLYDNNPQKIFTIPNDTIIGKEDYYVVQLTKAYLNNDENGDSVTLRDLSGNEIDGTPVLKDELDSSSTHQYCSGEWVFVSQTKGTENNCEEETQPPAQQNEEEPQNEEVFQEEEQIEEDNDKEKVIVDISDEENYSYKESIINLTPIHLNSSKPSNMDNAKNIKSENNKENLGRNLAFSGVIAFCVAFGALFLLRLRKNKNEFK